MVEATTGLQTHKILNIVLASFRWFVDDLDGGTAEPHHDLVHHDGGEMLRPHHGLHQLLLSDDAVLVAVDLRHDLVH